MTNELKIEKTAKIEALNLQLAPMYQSQKKRFERINKELTDAATALTNLPMVIKAEIALESIRFFTIVENRYSTEINIYNYYNWSEDFKKMYDSFNPELSTSGIRLKYSGQKNDEELTRIKLTAALATELENYYTENVGSVFISRIVECFREIRVFQKEITQIEIEISTIKIELDKAKKEEDIANFQKSFKQDNWYQSSSNPLHVQKNMYSGRGNYETFLHVKKVSEKTVTIDIYKSSEVHSGFIYAYNTRRISLEEAYSILKTTTLLTESPIKKETV